MSTATLMSVEQFEAMPRDGGVDYELVEGELIEVSSPTARHAWIRDELRGSLRDFLRRTRLGVSSPRSIAEQPVKPSGSPIYCS